jgi:hypothetical protein
MCVTQEYGSWVVVKNSTSRWQQETSARGTDASVDIAVPTFAEITYRYKQLYLDCKVSVEGCNTRVYLEMEALRVSCWILNGLAAVNWGGEDPLSNSWVSGVLITGCPLLQQQIRGGNRVRMGHLEQLLLCWPRHHGEPGWEYEHFDVSAWWVKLSFLLAIIQ